MQISILLSLAQSRRSSDHRGRPVFALTGSSSNPESTTSSRKLSPRKLETLKSAAVMKTVSRMVP